MANPAQRQSAETSLELSAKLMERTSIANETAVLVLALANERVATSLERIAIAAERAAAALESPGQS